MLNKEALFRWGRNLKRAEAKAVGLRPKVLIDREPLFLATSLGASPEPVV
jgi:hypothetical protein